MRTSSTSPIAVIGMGCRFPGAPNLEAFTRLLLDERTAIGELPQTRFDAGRYYDADPQAYAKSYSRIGACVDDVGPIDLTSLGLDPAQTAGLDTVHVWALDAARATLAHAGLDPMALRGENVGVIFGHARSGSRGSDMAFSAAIDSLLRDLDTVDSLRGLPPERLSMLRDAIAAAVHRRYPLPPENSPPLFRANETAVVVGRTFGFTGRHLVADAACASSLAAIDVAVRALRQGRMRMALAGGASFTSSSAMVLFAEAQALSADGSFPFDARANGFVCSEGVGMVLLARLDDALAQGYPIRGLIHGVGGSSDGRGKGLWAPNKSGQLIALRNAYERCDVDPSSISYVEAHGTSTALGDATEAESLSEFFGAYMPTGRKIAVGSVKSNIGHCREAAGIASLLKVLIALEHERIPASVNYREPNPHIDWTRTPLELADTTRDWRRGEAPRFAGIDSFGIGGLNYHVIVEEAPTPARLAELAGADVAIRAAQQPIALVGVACVLPGSRGPEAFWQQLQSGATAIDTMPASRFPADIYCDPRRQAAWRATTSQGGFIRDFVPNWQRYRMPPKLVERTDPLQLLLLECALDALADAGIDPEQADRQRISTTVGTVFGTEYSFQIDLAIRAGEAADFVRTALEADGLAHDVAERAGDEILAAWRARLPHISEDTSGSASASPLASRIAMTLDLHGSTFAVDAGLSSSLAALEIACESLQAGHADVALWAGADRGLSVPRFVDASRVGRLSPRGTSAPFDADADGEVLAEGVATGVLMRLSDAQAQGRRIYAVIRGVGSASEIELDANGADSAPPALTTAMHRAHELANVPPATIGYVEAATAGVRTGDDALIAAARTMIAAGDQSTLLVGSIVGNIGNAQGASGAASLLKVALALHHHELPATVGIAQPNPGLANGLAACTARQPFPDDRGHARAAVAGAVERGTSYHVVLEQVAEPAAIAREPIVFRASDRRMLERQLVAAAGAADDAFAPGSVHGVGSVAAATRPGAGLAARLDAARKALAAPQPSVVLAASGVCVTDYTLPGDTCFMFSGQGSQYPGMLRDVVPAYPQAAAVLATLDEALVQCGQPPLSHVIWERTELLDEVLWTQMAVLGGDLVMFEVARAHGLVPQLITGHSYGDYPALVAAGAWSVEQVVQMTVLRCQSILHTELPGAMAAVFADRSRVAALLVGIPGYAAQSNINAPDEIVVSGEPEAIDSLLQRCNAEGVTAKKLPVPRAFHSELMRPAVAIVEGAIADIAFAAPAIPFMTSAGATVISAPAELRRALVDQFTRPVDFIAQIEAAYAAGCRRFVEIGPGKVLARLAARILGGRPAVAVSLDDKKTRGLDAVESALAVLRAHDVSAHQPSVTSSATVDAVDKANVAAWTDAGAGLPVAGKLAAGEIRFFDVTGLASPPARVGPAKPTSRIDAATDAAPVVAISEPGPSSGAIRKTIEDRIIDLVCESSGYPRDLLSLDSDLEADLGIDTVKQAQILGRIREHYDLPADEHLAIREVPTPKHLADYVEALLVREAPQSDVVVGPAAEEATTPAAASERAIIRTVETALTVTEPGRYRPARIVLLGGGAVAASVSALLMSRGTQVVSIPLDQSPDTIEALVEDAISHGPLPDLCLLTGVDRATLSRKSRGPLFPTLAHNGNDLFESAFRVAQAWLRRIENDAAGLSDGGTKRRSVLSAITALGGALGHGNLGESLPEGGGVLGLCKNLRREFPAVRVKALDVERDESPDVAAQALLAELDSDDQRLEVGWLRGTRVVPTVIPTPAAIDPERLTALRSLPYLLVTGGGNGITAEIVIRLAQLGIGRFHLLGRTPIPDDIARWRDLQSAGLDAMRAEVLEQLKSGRRPRRGSGPITPAEWDEAWDPIESALAIERNLQRINAAGGDAVYHTVDVANQSALAQVLDVIRAGDGPVRAIIHGAGVQQSRSFLTKTALDLLATLAPKLDGTRHLIELTTADPLELFVSFGSVSGRFGGKGQADYSLACDLLARMTSCLAARRPSCRAVTIAWPGWGEVGMAARTRHLFLADPGKGGWLMPVEEGCQHFINEMLAGDPEPEVVIGGRILVMDLDGQVARGEDAERHRSAVAASADRPLVDAVLSAETTAVTVECRLDADRDPFLVQHRHAHTAILPAVVSLELMAEAASLLRPERLVALEHVVIGAGVKLSEVRRLPLRCAAALEGDAATVSISADHVGRHARLLSMNRVAVTGTARFGAAPVHSALGPIATPRDEDVLLRCDSPHAIYSGEGPESLAPAEWFHGPAFRTLDEFVMSTGSCHLARLVALPATALRPWCASEWVVPAPTLDGCLAMCVQITRSKLLADGLPVAFGRLTIGRQPEPGEVCELRVRERGHDERRVHFDFVVRGEDGSLILEVEDYVLRTFHRIKDVVQDGSAVRRTRRAGPDELWTTS